MRISKKLLSGFLAVSLLTMAISYVTSMAVQRDTIKNFQYVGGEIMPGSIAMARMTSELYHILVLTSRFAEKENLKDKEKIEEALATLNVYKTMHTLYHLEDKAWNNQIDEFIQRFTSYITKYLLMIQKGADEEDLYKKKVMIYEFLNEFISSANLSIENEFTEGSQKLEEAKQKTIKAHRILIASNIIILIAAFALSLFISRLISRPILKLRDATLKVGEGQLDIFLETKSGDEIGELGNAFNMMSRNLSLMQEELISTNIDLTAEVEERKRVEEALLKGKTNLESVLESLPGVFYQLHPSGKYVHWNKNFEIVSGYSGEEIANMYSLNFFPERQRALINSTFEKVLSEGYAETEVNMLTKGGNEIPFFLTGSLKSIDGAQYIVGMALDLTERKKLEEQFFRAQKMEAVGHLAGGIAHDFNNIISAVIGYAELSYPHAKNDPELSQYLEIISDAGERAAALVGQILTFSRKTEQKKIPLQLSSLVKETLKMMRSTIPTNIKIIENIQSKRIVLADSAQIYQVILNLCTNAHHSMRETGGTLTVSVTEVRIDENEALFDNIASGEYVRIEVNDTGVGIDTDIKEKIFEPYFTTKSHGEGSGLGLAVVHGIVKGHNGHISVYSDPGKGTSFHVYLPIIEGQAGDLTEKAEELELLRGSERIIFIDDEENIVNFAKKVLTKNGYTVTVFTNGVQAFQEFEKRPHDFDLIITDMAMPYMTGVELSHKILEIRADIPIILSSGFSDSINMEKSKAIGIAEYINKPYLSSQLLKTIRNAMNQNT